jgi:type VI secretion system secreted protein Hcp
MAIDMFLKIDDVKGESKDQAHAGEIDVLAWSFGESNSGSTHVGGGGAPASKVNVQDLSITKYVDKSSPALLLSCANGKHHRTVKLTVRKPGERPIDYVVMELTDVLISSVSVGGSGGEDRLTENVSLNFAKFKYSYTPQKADGTADTPVSMKWDIVQNTSA